MSWGVVMTEWHDFFVAEAGASAALAGLIAVGLSISLAELLRYPHLLLRAAGALTLLMAVLVTSTMLLAPGRTMHTIGMEMFRRGPSLTEFLSVSWRICRRR